MDLFDKSEGLTKKAINPLSPLADKMRPQSFDEFVGQQKIVGPNSPLRKAIDADRVSSCIFWGPPGSGKTTLAELIAKATKGQFIPFSAVTSGIKEIKEVISKAGSFYQLSGKRTYIFVDEIHRFNRAQQDAFLPYVEKGDIILIGATTENPSFEVNSALLSRMRVYVLERLTPDDIKQIILRALSDPERGIAKLNLTLGDQALDFIATAADGDARRGLTLLEATAAFLGAEKEVTVAALTEVHQRGMALYDKDREEHYNIISALHKTIRGGDPDAAIYWLARMLTAGEDPMYVLRRLIRFAVEDIGLADPYALTLALNAKETYDFLGTPEGELAITMLVIYMACAPKSNAAYIAHEEAKKDATQKGSLPVPIDIRNAPTSLMKAVGYGKEYKYAHDFTDAITDQEYFPSELKGTRYYHPTDRGRELKIKEYLGKYQQIRTELMKKTESSSIKKG